MLYTMELGPVWLYALLASFTYYITLNSVSSSQAAGLFVFFFLPRKGKTPINEDKLLALFQNKLVVLGPQMVSNIIKKQQATQGCASISN